MKVFNLRMCFPARGSNEDTSRRLLAGVHGLLGSAELGAPPHRQDADPEDGQEDPGDGAGVEVERGRLDRRQDGHRSNEGRDRAKTVAEDGAAPTHEKKAQSESAERPFERALRADEGGEPDTDSEEEDAPGPTPLGQPLVSRMVEPRKKSNPAVIVITSAMVPTNPPRAGTSVAAGS